MGLGGSSSVNNGSEWPDVEAALQSFNRIITTPVEELLARIYQDNHETPAAYNELWWRMLRGPLSAKQRIILKNNVYAAPNSAMKLLLLGDLSQYGIGVPTNKQEAICYYEQAIAYTPDAQLSDYVSGAAHWQLARYYLINEHLSPAYRQKARHHYEMGLHYQNDNAIVEYGDCWETGRLGLKENPDNAKEYYIKGIKLNSARAYNDLAVLYHHKINAGETTPLPSEEIYQLFLQAVSLGSDIASVSQRFYSRTG